MKLNTTSIIPAIAASSALFLTSCGDDPAENVNQAETSAAIEKNESDAPSGSVRYEFTEDSTITFVGSKKVGASHEGGFKDFTGYFTLKDGEPVGNQHKVMIQMESIYSDNEKLTKHLKSDDFFAIDEFKTSVFDVTSIESSGESGYMVAGNLTLRGETKNIKFPAEVSLAEGVASLQAEFKINRMDFGVAFQGTKDNIINEDVVIRFDLNAKAAE